MAGKAIAGAGAESKIVPLSERVRQRLLKQLGSKPCPTCGHAPRGRHARLLEIGEAIGLSLVQKFLAGGDVRSSSLDKISAWLDEQAGAGS